eukprot:scaffold294920_cov59-Attheya_sp.AAC.3
MAPSSSLLLWAPIRGGRIWARRGSRCIHNNVRPHLFSSSFCRDPTGRQQNNNFPSSDVCQVTKRGIQNSSLSPSLRQGVLQKHTLCGGIGNPTVTYFSSQSDAQSLVAAATVPQGGAHAIHSTMPTAWGVVQHRCFAVGSSPGTEEDSLGEELTAMRDGMELPPTGVAGDSSAFPTSEGKPSTRFPTPAGALVCLKPGYSAGQALAVLRIKHHTRPNNYIRLTEFHDLCLAARPYIAKDAGVIRTALCEFRRINEFILNREGAEVAMEGMLRAMRPWKDPTGEEKVNAALFVAEVFLDEKSSLYYASSISNIDKLLAILLEAVSEAGIVRKDPPEEDVEEEADESTKKKKKRGSKYTEMELGDKVFHITTDVIALLIRRGSHPNLQMKKRAARKYKKLIKVIDGPKATTMHTASEILIKIDGPDAAQEYIIQPCVTNKWPKFFPDEKTLQMIESSRKEEATLAATSPPLDNDAVSPVDTETDSTDVDDTKEKELSQEKAEVTP